MPASDRTRCATSRAPVASYRSELPCRRLFHESWDRAMCECRNSTHGIFRKLLGMTHATQASSVTGDEGSPQARASRAPACLCKYDVIRPSIRSGCASLIRRQIIASSSIPRTAQAYRSILQAITLVNMTFENYCTAGRCGRSRRA